MKPVTPSLTVDAIIQLIDRPGRLVLIERKNPPYGFALPGGFVDIGETVEQAVLREIKEETNLGAKIEALLGVYSDPSRDTRGHNVSVVFVVSAYSNGIQALDDAAAIKIVNLNEIDFNSLAFDHAKIIKDYLFMLEKFNTVAI
jgi:8-oxo-dGTP diphosphatase